MPHPSLILVLITSLFWSLCASGATVWKATDRNTNYLSLDGTPELSFALVDYDELTNSVDITARLIFESGDQIRFSRNSGRHFARNNTDPTHPKLALGTTKFFVICANDGNGWQLDDGAPQRLGTNMYALNFQFPGDIQTLIQVDAKPVTCVTTVVPLPPAALLLPGGLAMLLMNMRRKTRRRCRHVVIPAEITLR